MDGSNARNMEYFRNLFPVLLNNSGMMFLGVINVKKISLRRSEIITLTKAVCIIPVRERIIT